MENEHLTYLSYKMIPITLPFHQIEIWASEGTLSCKL